VAEIISLEELSARLNYSVKEIKNFVDRKQIPFLEKDGVYSFPYEEVLEAGFKGKPEKAKPKPTKPKEKETEVPF